MVMHSNEIQNKTASNTHAAPVPIRGNTDNQIGTANILSNLNTAITTTYLFALENGLTNQTSMANNFNQMNTQLLLYIIIYVFPLHHHT